MNYDQMQMLKSRISKIDAGSVLDIATGRGEFLKFAMNTFHSWTSASGIDFDKELLEKAAEAFKGSPVILIYCSALSMPFTNHYFDTITLSNALHHIEDTQKLFIEIKRVCKIGGSMVINEMLNEGNAAMQDTYMQYHRFMAEIDRQLGQFHREPFSLKELTALVKNYQLLSIEHFVHAESTGDAMNASEIDAIADRINKKVTLLKGADFFYFFENKARELIERLRRSGIYRPRHAFFLVRV